MKLLNRIKRARRAGKLKAFDYMIDDGGFLRQVLCKVCAAPIQSLVPMVDADGHRVVIDGDKVPMVLSVNSSYREVILFFDDGSSHRTNLCKNCLNGLHEIMDDVYLADVARLMTTDSTGTDWKLWERRPVGFAPAEKS